MAIATTEILEILHAHDIVPEERAQGLDLPATIGPEFPEIGEIRESESVYSTSLAEVLREDDEGENNVFGLDDPRIRDWWEKIEQIIDGEREAQAHRAIRTLGDKNEEPPEPHCAWYCPIHFFGHGWGIYIRESCILSHTWNIASYVNWRAVSASHPSIARQLLRSAFYVFFLHEQFHHKVESLGFRLLISTGSDRYRPYKAKVYRASYLTPDCLEESLANAESFRRLGERRYIQRVDKPIRDGLRDFMRATIPAQPPGYAEGVHYFPEDTYRDGLYKLQSQTLDGALIPTTPIGHWSVAPNMITALMDITDDIYVVLPKGARPIFRPTSVDPGATVSTNALVGALTRHYGYEHVSGGKGSHVKLNKPGAQTIILPGNRPVLSPGVVKHALEAVGGHPISRLPELLAGRLRAEWSGRT
jgi:hypothetical protein